MQCIHLDYLFGDLSYTEFLERRKKGQIKRGNYAITKKCILLKVAANTIVKKRWRNSRVIQTFIFNG